MSVLLDAGDLQKLFRIWCQFLGKGSFCKEKHQENIEHIVSINTKNNNPSLHPRKNCQKCHCVMSATIKRKSTWRNLTFSKRGSWKPKIWLQEKNQRHTHPRQKERTPADHKVSLTHLFYKTRSQQWRFKCPCFSLDMQNLLKNN